VTAALEPVTAAKALRRLAELFAAGRLGACIITLSPGADGVSCSTLVIVDGGATADTREAATATLDTMWQWSQALGEPLVTTPEGDTYALSVSADHPRRPVTVVARVHKSVFLPVEKPTLVAVAGGTSGTEPAPNGHACPYCGHPDSGRGACLCGSDHPDLVAAERETTVGGAW
jgi:hypothetical protein